MKYIMAQPSVPRFEWELQVCIHNLLKIGIEKKDIVILFSRHSDSVYETIKSLGVDVHIYNDERDYYGYIPSLKPYLMYRYLDEDKSREKENYFYIDSDVIFREKVKYPRFTKKTKTCFGSDCNGYLNYDYIMQCKNGEDVLNGMAEVVGISVDQIKAINKNSIGAQYILNHPTSEMFEKIYKDSNELWKYLKDRDTDIQKWTAEMWATLWNLVYFGINPKVHKELAFSWATDPIEQWDKAKIYHNAGVVDENQGLFFKGQYIQSRPFDVDHDYIDKEKNSYNYVKEIMETKDWLEKNKKKKGEI